MTKVTHLFIGVATTLPIVQMHPMAAVGMVGAILPDYDLRLGLPHRTVTHSLLFLAIISGLFWLVNIYMGLVSFIAISSHLAADSCTKMGVPLFYPHKKCFGWRKIRTGEKEENYFILGAVALILAELWITKRI